MKKLLDQGEKWNRNIAGLNFYFLCRNVYIMAAYSYSHSTLIFFKISDLLHLWMYNASSQGFCNPYFIEFEKTRLGDGGWMSGRVRTS